MQASNSKPFILIVPGAFCVPSLYEQVAGPLRTLGYDVDIVAHKTVSKSSTQQSAMSMYDDAANIRSLLRKQADMGKEIILVMHSYGGIAGTEATKGLSTKERKPTNKLGGIIKLVYVAALVARKEESASDIIGTLTLPDLSYEEGQISIGSNGARKVFFSALGDDAASALTKQLLPISNKPLTDRATWQGYEHIPCAYFVATHDLALPYETQKKCLATLEAFQPNVVILEFAADHFPWNSHPNQLFNWINKLASGL